MKSGKNFWGVFCVLHSMKQPFSTFCQSRNFKEFEQFSIIISWKLENLWIVWKVLRHTSKLLSSQRLRNTVRKGKIIFYCYPKEILKISPAHEDFVNFVVQPLFKFYFKSDVDWSQWTRKQTCFGSVNLLLNQSNLIFYRVCKQVAAFSRCFQ